MKIRITGAESKPHKFLSLAESYGVKNGDEFEIVERLYGYTLNNERYLIGWQVDAPDNQGLIIILQEEAVEYEA